MNEEKYVCPVSEDCNYLAEMSENLEKAFGKVTTEAIINTQIKRGKEDNYNSCVAKEVYKALAKAISPQMAKNLLRITLKKECPYKEEYLKRKFGPWEEIADQAEDAVDGLFSNQKWGDDKL